MTSETSQKRAGSARRRARTMAATAVSAAVLLTVTAGCGTDTGPGAVPEGWDTLTSSAVTVAYPPAFSAQSDAERSKYNAAAATFTEGGKSVGMITVQLDFTNADSVEEAAIGAEAGIALGSKLGRQQKIVVAGPDGEEEARRVNFEFTEKGTRYQGVIVAGLDSAEKSYAVRIDAARGTLDDGDLNKIIESITVK
ncbi:MULTISPECIES: hypothetical protein [unclassified Streptomyces]|uniref:hypothetical protein n=1 Tax=unclassified Streptomyces TaxID=2593676 RepID=UPI00081E7658|nr:MULTISPECIES: hypothetical protein [unclassified Streptomyces]MYZ37062.1 hypothetical protein [Streptomyces sp. SID4917]SCF88386.1 hypothetical protein GA0115259_104195 [Streptomyces sp. MnatMP-M17]